MSIFKRNKNNFEEPQKISGGDLYESYIQKLTQQQIDINTLVNKQNIDGLISSNIDEQTLQPYYLLELQANYFINIINYECDNLLFFQKIKQLLRICFKNGNAGILKQNGKYIIGAINQIENDIYGELISAKLTPLNNNEIFFKDEKELDNKPFININENNKNNFIILKWGSAGLSAWITIYKYCLIQHELMLMLNTDKYSYVKKMLYKINDPNDTFDEMENYFNPKIPFLKIKKGVDLKNRIEINEVFNNTNPNILIEYYKQVQGIYYSLYGRRINNDYKKERNLVKEMELNADNFNVLEKDIIDEFKVFINEVKTKFNENIWLIEPLAMEGDNDDEQQT